jgi:hypothetical protein
MAGSGLGVLEIVEKPDQGLAAKWCRPESKVFQVFARFEPNRLTGRDCDLDARLRVPSYTTFAVAYLKHAKTPELDSFSVAKGMFHLRKNCFDSLSCLHSGDIRGLCDTVYEVGFDHVSSVRRRSVAARYLAVNDSEV